MPSATSARNARRAGASGGSASPATVPTTATISASATARYSPADGHGSDRDPRRGAHRAGRRRSSPPRNVGEAEVVAVAARDRSRAEAFASKHGIPKVCDSYAALVADPDIDAIYNPLPNGLHAEWTIAALEAGKHVLCEKPFTANAKEAEDVAAVAARTGLVVMEAFHYRYHPLAPAHARDRRERRARDHPARRDRARASRCPKFSDIRYQYDLAGGATMDVGTYTVHMARLLGCEEPEVVSAEAKLRTPDVDRAMRAELSVPERAHRSHHVLDVVALGAPDLRPRDRRPR